MKLLFTRFPLESAHGGAEVQTMALMKGLAARGHAVAFAGSCPVLLELCRKEGIPAVAWDIGPPPVTKTGAVSFAWRHAWMRRRLKTLLAQFHDLDAIAMLSLTEKLLLTDQCAKDGIRTVWIEHDRIGRWLTKNPWKPLLLRQSRHATTVTVSDLSKTLYRALGWEHDRVLAIPNGVDEQRLRAMDGGLRAAGCELREDAVRNPKLSVGCIARLSREKGVDTLIEAVTDMDDVHLEIIGTGREEGALRRMADELDVSERITWTQQEDDIAAAYGRFDVLVLPSRDHDPFGLVAAEAMLLGIPVVVTDACGIAGYVTHGEDAVIVPADRPGAMREAIQHLASDIDARKKLALQGQKTARELFSLDAMVKGYEEVFTNK